MRGTLIVCAVATAGLVSACTASRASDAGRDVPPFDALAAGDAVSPLDAHTTDVHRTRDDGTESPDSGALCTCGGPTPCPGGHHVDCFRELRCDPRTRTVFVNPHAPYHACDADAAAALRAADICGQYGRMNGYVTCREGCRTTPSDPRYDRCLPYGLPFDRYRWLVRYLCAGARTEGSVCENNDDCHPVADVPDLALVCDAGRCQRVPRPHRRRKLQIGRAHV